MSENWRDRLQKILSRFGYARKQGSPGNELPRSLVRSSRVRENREAQTSARKHSSSGSEPPQSPVRASRAPENRETVSRDGAENLGADFEANLTKVGFKDVAAEKSNVSVQRTVFARFGNAPKPGSPEVKASRLPITASRAPENRQTISRDVAINLGIDFGTSFTKVCFRDVGTEESGVIAGDDDFKNGLVPSIVAIDSSGQLYLHNESAPSDHILVPYLKMRLADSPIGDDLPSIDGINLNGDECTRALACWFLAAVIMRSQRWMFSHEGDRLRNRTVKWSANVGVPVEYFDSALLKKFEKVLGVAWLWVRRGKIPGTLADAIAECNSTATQADEEIADFHAIPEIAAAVQSFVMSREAVPGIYVYFDIGGGTIDGVAFNFINYNGERRINFYSGKVEPLGVSALAAALNTNVPDEVDSTQLKKIIAQGPRERVHGFEKKIQRLVGEVVMTAKKKDGRNWQRDAIQNPHFERKFIGRLEPSQMQPLIVFIGGGGCRSQWYRSSINSTYEEFQQVRADIPPYKLVEVPKPKDLAMHGPGDAEFMRFAIGYGLSIPYGEGPAVGLPSEFSAAPPPAPWRPPGLVDYADSKDVYD